MVKVSEILLAKIILKDVRGARYRFADYLAENGYEPRHWYANWKKIDDNVWIVISGKDRGDPSELTLYAKVVFSDKAPNLAGTEYFADKKKAMEVLKKEVIPKFRTLLENCAIVKNVEWEVN